MELLYYLVLLWKLSCQAGCCGRGQAGDLGKGRRAQKLPAVQAQIRPCSLADVKGSPGLSISEGGHGRLLIVIKAELGDR